MMFLQPNKRQRLLTNPARLPLLTALEKKESITEVTYAAALMNFSEEAKQAMELLNEAMNSVWYIYDDDICRFEGFHHASAREN